ncbi:hypothetical protein MHI57_08005 [Cytobacillus sp. FSL K6-0129]|uniref:hypothetical protein n=1 Tax=Cytobacillus sp. FSL K6-0129 TaxID=2921421 RepID=UPI0030FBBD7A
MSFVFNETSEYISKPFKVEDGIKKLLLYTNEKVPESYKEKVSESNDWIQHAVSFDDIEWYRISPQHHQPVHDDLFPPQSLLNNDNESNIEDAFSLNKANLLLNEIPKQVRFKLSLRGHRMEKRTKRCYILQRWWIVCR